METAKVYRFDKVQREESAGVRVLGNEWVLAAGPGAAALRRCGTGAVQLVVTMSSQVRAQTLTEGDKYPRAHTSR